MEQHNKINFKDKALFHLINKKRAVVLTALWFIGGLLLLLAMSDLFTQSIFNKKYLLLQFLFLINTVFIFKMWKVYISKKKSLY
ncbi:MAG: hypothetical protein CMP77_09190 [Flavobacterium sp.]|nr:hypothetical protein [Flavobacterium sp.]|tara:strand:- start:1005 stop:1256 length:252 start_codon:yes stop_codon:yes gene_type:complete